VLHDAHGEATRFGKHIALTLDRGVISFIPTSTKGNFADMVSENDTLNLHKS
jgi:hypothetical protein